MKFHLKNHFKYSNISNIIIPLSKLNKNIISLYQRDSKNDLLILKKLLD